MGEKLLSLSKFESKLHIFSDVALVNAWEIVFARILGRPVYFLVS